jgi:hypothetical protein
MEFSMDREILMREKRVESGGTSEGYMLCSRGESCLSGIIHNSDKFIISLLVQ